MEKIGILFNSRITAAQNLAQELEKQITGHDVDVWVCAAADESDICRQLAGTDMILSLGGDGTMLRAARLAAPEGVPILGINMGTLGFTTELLGDETVEKLPRFLSGEGWIDERAMLQAEFPFEAGVKTLHALNDVVVGRGSILRVIKVKASVNNQPVTTYKGDGIIAATATGSTGYSLAAGGPILFPNADEILLTPITPHLGLTAALVLSGQSEVELQVETAHEAKISIDGQVEYALKSGDVVRIKRSPFAARLLRIQPRSFFHQTLLERLSGKRG